MSEHDEQVALFDWAAWNESKYPQLKWCFAIPNGGKRNITVATKLKAEGVKKGILDICLPVARHGYHGLFIEMKYGKNKPTKEQTEFIEFLREQNYKTAVCYSVDEAIKVIEDYLEVEK